MEKHRLVVRDPEICSKALPCMLLQKDARSGGEVGGSTGRVVDPGSREGSGVWGLLCRESVTVSLHVNIRAKRSQL